MIIDIHQSDRCHNTYGIQAIGNCDEIHKFNIFMLSILPDYFDRNFFHQGSQKDWSFFEFWVEKNDENLEKTLEVIDLVVEKLNAEYGDIY